MKLIKPHIFTWLTILIFSMPATKLHAENSIAQTPLEESSWEELSSDLDYSETFQTRKEADEKSKKEYSAAPPIKFPKWGRTLLFAITIGILGFLIFVIIRKILQNRSEQIKNTQALEVSVENLEENIHDADYSNLLDEALNNEAYKLAIRILYVNIIKLLSDKDFINWGKDKTNAQYKQEMQNQTEGKLFSALTSIYEKAWFGNYSMDYISYKKVDQYFIDFINKLT